MGWMIAAFFWGAAEATLFFIIPDVLLTAIALLSGKRALAACGWALVGALIGGTMMYVWGNANPTSAFSIVEQVPAIDPAMIAEVKANLQTDGLWALVLGPTQGIPYKIYAVAVAAKGVPYLWFLLVSIPARLMRFLLTVLITWGIAKYVLPKQLLRTKYCILAAAWIAIYIAYFALNPS